MNKTFHSIWNASKQAWVAAAETVSAKGKPTSGAKEAAVISALFGGLLAVSAHAQTAPPPNTLPTGGQLSAGQASIGQSSANMVITQSTDRAAINWNTFNVGSQAQVQFNQPSAASVTLNRVMSADPSQIFGRITANGQVILTNPSGVYFGPSARVDVGGLVATTMGMNDADFMAGNNRYQRNGSTGSVVNEGELKASLGGYIALLAPEVRNQGAVIAQMGTVALASGEAVDLRFDSNNRLTSLRVEPSQIAALVDNQHAVQAPGGLIIISAQSMDRLVGGVVKNSGNLEANSLTAKGGRIVLEGDSIELQSTSRIDASGATGGGTVLVGGDWQGSGDMHQATTVSMAAGAVIDASATLQGDGGKVVLWSDVGKADSVTFAAGTVQAKGGAQGGNGGQVETSGHSVDTANFSVNAGAERGTGGLWLIDPYDYTISSATSINTSLNSGTSVTIDTANPSSGSYSGSGGSGTITVSDNLAKTSGAAATLTLNASSAISGTGSISSSGNALGVVFNAGGGTGLYSGLISGNVSLTKSGAGSLSLMSANTYTGGTTLSAGTLGVYTNTAMGAGALTVSGNSNLLLGRGVTSIANNLTLNATLSVSYDTNVDYLMVGGGGGGGSRAGGGGGAGGFVLGSTTVGSGSYSVSVGAGGSGENYVTSTASTNGGNSSLGFVSTTAYGGGAGGGQLSTGYTAATNGGSGGGSQHYSFAAGTGVAGQGNAGGTGAYTDGWEQSWAGGGGGGAGGAGSVGWSTYSNGNSGNGGAGLSSTITGATVYYAGGGGGGLNQYSGGTLGLGGIGGGGNGSKSAAAASGVANTGGGGGGGGFAGGTNYAGGDGGSGVVIARYLGASAGTGGTVSAGTGTAAGYTMHTFTSTGGSTLALNALATTFSGNISGTGGLTVNGGSGSQITLTGNNTNTGTTTVSSGTLQVGSGSTSGTLSAGAVVNSAALVFNRSDALTVAGAISGSGTVTQSGSGTTTLTGNNNYSGTTAISAGTLQVGDGGTSGTLGTGAVTDSAALVFNRSDALTVAAAISGSGSVTQAGSGTTTLTANNTYSNATTISGGTLVLQNNAPSPSNKTFNGNGSLRIEPTATSFTSAFSTSGWTFASTLSSLTLGKSGNTRDLTIANATSIAGPISLYGGNIAINAGLTATGSNTITLAGSGTVTDGTSGYLSASKLLLTGGSVTLDSSSNAIGTLAASGVGGLTYVNSSALTLDTVGATQGVSATGVVSIGTQSGDLTVVQNVATTNATATALTLNADVSTAAGTSTGGNLIVSGNPTVSVGSGGTARLFTGSVSGSTGLTALVGSGSGRFRYNSDESATHYTAALSTGLNAIYREQPTVSVAVDDQTITYGDNLPIWTATASGRVNGDTNAQVGISISGVTMGGSTSTSGNAIAGSHTLTGSGSVVEQLGYAVAGSIGNGTLTVNQKTLTYSGTVAVRDYDGTRNATVTDAITGKVVGDTVSVASTSTLFDTKDAGASTKTVTVSGIGISGADSANYSIASTATLSGATINKVTVSLSASKAYDGTTTLSGSQVNIGGLVGSEALSYTGATASDAHVLTASKYINAITLANATDSSGGLASNYQLPALDATHAAVTIGAKPLTSTASITATAKDYDGTTAATGSTVSGSVSGAVAGDTISLVTSGLTLAYNDAHVATVNKTIGATGSTSFSIGSSTHSSVASDYSFTAPTISAVSGTINAATLTPTLTNTGVSKDYDGSRDAPTGFVPSWGFSGLVSGDTAAALSSTGSAYDSKNVASASKVTVSGLAIAGITGSRNSAASDYVLDASSKDVAATITAKTVTVGNLTASNKTYDGTTAATVSDWGSVSTGVGSETLGLSGVSATFANANAGNGKTVTATGYALANGSNGGLASNYQLSSTSATTTANIAQAALTVTANNDAKFLTQSDTSGYAGVSYSGFVHGETENTAGVLTGTLAIARTGGNTAAGTYNGVLVASGLSAGNYSISYANGNYTIVPSNQLLVRVNNVSNTYGTATQYAISSVEYFNGSAVVRLDNGSVSGSSVSSNASNAVVVNDGVGGVANFTLAPQSAVSSTANQLVVGSYQLGTSGTVTENSVNFSNIITVVGAHQVNTKGITVSASNVSKVYDGTTGMTGVSLNLATLETNDVVTVNGAGAFVSKNVGSNLGYSISNLALSGADAANYYLSGGSSFSGNNGVITARPLTVSYTASNKTYDGNASVSVTASDNRVSGDALTLSQSATFADKNVGVSKVVSVSGISLGGADAGNYSLTNPNQSAQTTANISRLNSVTWVGGASGNWFDPANWAGGAVPDLSNVANVVIPAGVVVSFNMAGAVAPADASQAVNVDSLGTSGSLSQTDGTLNVGTGGITLDALSMTGGTLTNMGTTHLNTYNQSGGSFSGTGNFNANGFTQTGGSTALQGDFTVNQNYSQSGSGSVTVGGNTFITDTSGGVVIGNLNTTGTTQITSTGGDITQAAGTAVVSGGAATLAASNSGAAANITLNGANNDFQAVVNANGANVNLTDVNALTLGTVISAGNLNINSTGALDLGSSTVGGHLSANSGNGNITQSGPLSVTGASNLTAGTGDITLTNPANDFTGTVSASGSNVSITDANALTLGTITTAGNLTVNSRGALDLGTSTVGGNLNANSGNGNITQAGPLSVTGTSNLLAGMGNIALTHPANNFVGVVSASGAHVSLTDANALTLGAVNSTGNLNVRSGGTLNLGGGMVSGALVATSDNNPITQSGALHVAGLAEFDAGISTVMLTNAGNEFSAGTQVTASNYLIVGDARKQAGDAEARAQSNQPVRALAGTALANVNAPQPLVLTSATASSSDSGSSGATGFASANSAGVTFDVQSVSQQEMPTMVAVSLPKGASTVGVGFSFELPESVKSTLQSAASAQASLPSGAMLPLWLRFDAQTLRFEATAVPDGAFPMQVVVTAGGQQMLVVISERME